MPIIKPTGPVPFHYWAETHTEVGETPGVAPAGAVTPATKAGADDPAVGQTAEVGPAAATGEPSSLTTYPQTSKGCPKPTGSLNNYDLPNFVQINCRTLVLLLV